MKHLNSLISHLSEVDEEYRSIPFWSWNDKLDCEELKRQIQMMKTSGVGGYFMHARGGLKTPYLENEWFECIKTGIEEGIRQGLNAWVYDEEGWPSGFAGGKVTALGDKVHARGLAFEWVEGCERANDTLGLFVHCEKTNTFSLANEGYEGKLLRIYHTSSEHYIDILNKDVTSEFIKATHSEYAKRFETGENGGLYGFFTDEPRLSEGNVPWSYIMLAEFSAEYDYDIIACLPALFFNCEGCEKVRFDFWKLVSKLFVSGYMQSIYNWCDEHSCKLTGHMMMEESLYSQMTGTSGSMPFYEYMHQPGVDSLRRNIADPRIPKQVGSASEQLGKKHVITESFALSGWDVSFEELRWITNWQFVNGVNLLCQHLQAYSLEGFRKRDYPPSLFYQQTWYGKYNLFNDYVGRLSKLLSDNKKLIDVLLLHPMHSGWVSYDGTNNDVIKKLDEDFSSACETLSGIHTDYHLGDEGLMKKYASIQGNSLKVGAYSYKAVVMPSMLTLDSNTLDLLLQFIKIGGAVISIGTFPGLCNGAPTDKIDKLRERTIFVETREKLRETLLKYTDNPIAICDENGAEISDIHACVLDTPFGRVLYAVNNNKNAGCNAKITVKGAFVSELLLEQPKTQEIEFTVKNDEISFDAEMLKMQCRLFVISDDSAAQAKAKKADEQRVDITSGEWSIDACGGNTLTLDSCEWQLENGEWHSAKPVIHLMKDLLDLKRPVDIALRFRFNSRLEGAELKSLSLVMERPEKYTISINGTQLYTKTNGWYKDIAFKKLDIVNHLIKGENCIELRGEFYQNQKVYDVLYGEKVYETELNKLTYDTELESIYLAGDFGVYTNDKFVASQRNSLSVDGGFYLDKMPAWLQSGCFTTQGFTFFADVLTISKTISISKGDKRVVLNLGSPRCGMAELYVNGKEVKTFLWAPYCADATDYISDGENTITVKLYASNRNMLGPHHHVKGENYSVGPTSFSGEFSWVERESEAVVITPEMRQSNFWSDKYSFVTFGI